MNKLSLIDTLRLIGNLIRRKDILMSGVKFVKSVTFIFSLLYLLGCVYQLGFYDITDQEYTLLHTLADFTKGIFAVSIIIFFMMYYSRDKGSAKVFSIMFAVLFYMSFIPMIFAQPAGSFTGAVWSILNNRTFNGVLLILYAVVTISKGFVGFVSRKINPAIMFMASFAIIILIGAGLLLLPKSTVVTEHLSWVDALFVSTSAVCVTGLTPVDISSVFTVQGQTIIMLLIQIGGLGVMTFTCFFALFFIGNTSLSNQLVIKDMISSESFGSLMSVLVNVLVFTVVIELCGAALLWLDIDGTMIGGYYAGDQIFFSVFHSISAFCNAGFSTLPNNLGNPLIMQGGNAFYLIISFLIILGGIGFPILVNFKALLAYKIQDTVNRIFHPQRSRHIRTHITNINTKLVVIWTAALLIAGTILFAIFEWHGAFRDMTFSQKLTHAFFNSAATRTAGFNSVDLTTFTLQSIIFYIILMWIGGASQSTAGGIKVNVFAVSMRNLHAIIKGKDRAEIFGREIAYESIRKANATILASILILFLFSFIISILEPALPFRSIIFECVSAMGTVGSSLNTTVLLGEDSKLLISALMFIGRIGVITFLMSFIPQSKVLRYTFPKEQVIIN